MDAAWRKEEGDDDGAKMGDTWRIYKTDKSELVIRFLGDMQKENKRYDEKMESERKKGKS